MQYLSSVYFVNQLLNVSGIFVAHHQKVYCICTAQQLVRVVYILVHYTSWWWATNMPETLEAEWRNKRRINTASSWFLLHRYNEMHGQRNIKSGKSSSNVTVLTCQYRGADRSLARPTSRCILFDGENISFDASLVIQSVPEGKDLTSGECSLGQTIPI